VIPAILSIQEDAKVCNAVIETPAGTSVWTSTTMRAKYMKVHPRHVGWVWIREGGR
jgi:hypothetical protein